MLEKSLPLQKRYKVDMVFHDASLHNQDTYCTIRAYNSLEHRQQSQDAFYGSPDWRLGPLEAMVSLIESYSDMVLKLEAATLNGLRK